MKRNTGAQRCAGGGLGFPLPRGQPQPAAGRFRLPASAGPPRPQVLAAGIAGSVSAPEKRHSPFVWPPALKPPFFKEERGRIPSRAVGFLPGRTRRTRPVLPAAALHGARLTLTFSPRLSLPVLPTDAPQHRVGVVKSRAPSAGRSPCDLRAIRFPGTFFASLGWPTTRFPPPRVMEAERTPSVLFTEVSAPRRRPPPCDMSAFACPPDLPELWRGFRVGP